MSSVPILCTVADETTKQIMEKIKKMYTYTKNYHVNRKQLEKKRTELLDLEEDVCRQVELGAERLEQPTAITKSWFDDVKTVRDDKDIDELIDEEIRKANDRCCFGLLLCNIKYRYRMSTMAEEKTKEIHEAISRVPHAITLPINVTELESAPTEFLAGLKSREKLIVAILDKLRDEKVYSVALCGMGAIGKTTLAKEVKKKGNGDFDVIAMAEVSERPDIGHIQDQIAESIGLRLQDYGTTAAHKAKNLYTRLKEMQAKGSKDKKGCKILIIIDNIWENLNLADVGIPFERSNGFCCKILFTSREKDVCRVMGVEVDNIISVPLLTENEAESLFCTRIGKEDAGDDFREIQDRLLKKCGGLPLTIVATAYALKAQSLNTWKRFANELESNISGTEFHETSIVLETSYKFIHNEDKKDFFLLACLFLPGSKISIDNMMRYGIGLDLFQYVNKLSDAMDQAKKWADELKSSSLLQEDESEDYVKIHDVVRESAISFAVKDGHKMIVEAAPRWLSKKTWEKYTAISLTSVFNYNCLSGLRCDKLEILLLHGGKILEEEFFGGMTNLKVLGLRYMDFVESFPKSIATLKNVKTLLLEECRLGDIKVVGELESLLVLSFKGSIMKEVPEEIGNLYNLRVLDLRMFSISNEIVSAGIISRLSQLEGLFVCPWFVKWADVETASTVAAAVEEPNSNNVLRSQPSVAELNNLSHLDVLEMLIPHSSQLPSNGKFVEKLNKFMVSIGVEYKPIERPEFLGVSELASSSSPLSCLPLPSRTLIIHQMNFHHVLKYTWLNVMIHKTEFLRLSNICGLKFLYHELNYKLYHAGFKDLKHLHVEGCNDMECIVSTDTLVGMTTVFPKLESLLLSSMNMLKTICNGVVATSGMFSNLRDVSLEHLIGLQTYALPINLARQLTSIKVRDCKNLNFIFLGNASDREDESCSTTCLRSLKKLILIDLPQLQNLMGEANSSDASDRPQCQYLLHKGILLSSLEELELRNVPIRELWDSPPNENSGSNNPYFGSFRNLKHVTIDSCGMLESLGVPSVASYLMQVERLEIRKCTKMSRFLSQERDGERLKRRSIIFPMLKKLILYKLHSLITFYEGNHQLELSALKRLKMIQLPRIVSVAISGDSTLFFNDKMEFPCLEELTLWSIRQEVDEVKEVWHPTTISNPLPQLNHLEIRKTRGLQLIPEIAFQQLSTLELYRCDNNYLFSTSITSVPQNQMPNLEYLSLEDNELMEGLFRNNLNENENDAVKKICCQLRGLVVSGVNKINVIPLHLFRNLTSLAIKVEWECLFTSELVTQGIGQLFPMLEILILDDCTNMKIVLDNEFGAAPQFIDFPRLKHLVLFSFVNGTSFNSTPNSTLVFPSLEELEIIDSNFRSVFLGNVIAPILNDIQLTGCKTMTTVFNMTKLPSLRAFGIDSCPHLQTLSEEPLEALLLTKVDINGCEYPLEQIDSANHPINSFLKNQYKERMLKIEREGEEEETEAEKAEEAEKEEEEEEEEEEEMDGYATTPMSSPSSYLNSQLVNLWQR